MVLLLSLAWARIHCLFGLRECTFHDAGATLKLVAGTFSEDTADAEKKSSTFLLEHRSLLP